MTGTAPAQIERQPLNVSQLMRELEKLVPRDEPDRAKKWKGDLAALAALRRGLGKDPGEAPAMFAVLYSRIPEEQLPLSSLEERIIFLVASLFALYPPQVEHRGWRGDLGASMRQLAEQSDSDGPERRFIALLNSDVADLSHHLRGIVGLLKSAKSPIPVDWVRLTWDLRRWNNADRAVQIRWATAFWGGRRVQETTDEPAAEGTE